MEFFIEAMIWIGLFLAIILMYLRLKKRPKRCEHGFHGDDCYMCHQTITKHTDLVHAEYAPPAKNKPVTIERPAHPKHTEHIVHVNSTVNEDSDILDDVVTGIAIASLMDSDRIYVETSSDRDWSGDGGGFDGGGASDDY